MSTTTDGALHPDLTEGDMENVRAMLQGLLDDVRRRENERQLMAAVVTWINAFSSFKRLRKNVGMPSSPRQCLFYGAMLGSLKSAGKMLLAWLDKENIDPIVVGLRLEDIKACVQELVEDDRILDLGLLEADYAEFEKKYCSA